VTTSSPAPLRYPALYEAASKASKNGQNRYIQAIRVRLISLVLAAVGGAISWGIGGVEVLAWLALVSFVIALAAEVVIFALHPEQVWYEGRAAAESAKTLTWRYAVAGDPFPATLPNHAADTAFLAQLAAIIRDLTISLPPLEEGGEGQITDEMRELRARSLSERKNAYLVGRIDDQQKWYGHKSRVAETRNTLFLLGAITFEFVGVIAATLRVTGVIGFDMLGIVAALTAGIASWTQTRQYGSIARAYSIASNELSTIRSQASLVDNTGWARFVNEAEHAISREHTLWRASRGVLNVP
jgi:SMODS and SLOG-associating 2TM effector domain 3/SMODS and SLOG-associating 2TM effector domain 1